MVYVIGNPAVPRGRRRRPWWVRASMFTAAATLTGGTLGAMLGATGTLLGEPTRGQVAAAFAAVGLTAGALELVGRKVPLLQFNRETAPNRTSGALAWAARNGVALGSGVATRIGFAAWYIVPVSALLLGNTVFGATIYGIYAFARGSAPWILILSSHRTQQSVRYSLVRKWTVARRASGAVTLTAAVVALLVAA